MNERDKSCQQMKEKTKEKTNLVAAANRIAFMSRRVRLARIREKRGLVHLSEHESDLGISFEVDDTSLDHYPHACAHQHLR